jgi:hypothetical protein
MAEVATVAAAGHSRIRAERAPAVIRALPALLLFMAAALASQYFAGAYSGAIGAYPDEAAHYMSGLLIHDYVLSGLPEPPMEYAQRYYDRHPSLGIGYWPPAFYIAEALWMIPFGVSRASILVFCAVVCACLQFMLFQGISRRVEVVPALIAGVSFPLLPAVRYSNSMVMTDIFVALACFGATLSLAWFLERPGWRRAFLAGLWCSFALMSKLSAAYLVLVPPLAILISRRFDLLRRPVVLAPAGLVLLLTGPWLVYTRDLMSLGVLPDTPDSSGAGALLANYVRMLYRAGGPVVLAAIPGLLAVAFGPLRREMFWAAIAATPVALGLFLCFAPISLEPRHVITAIPALLILAVRGTQVVAGWITRRRFRMAVAALLLIVTVSAAALAGIVPAQYNGGLGKVADYLISETGRDSVILVSSTVIWREPAMVVELAQREPRRPGRRMLRSRKLFADTDWNATYYRPLVRTEDEALAALRRENVEYVALHSSHEGLTRDWPHVALLAGALQRAPEEWRPVRRFDGAPGESTTIFVRVPPER